MNIGADVKVHAVRHKRGVVLEVGGEDFEKGLQPLIEKVLAYCEANGIGAKTVTLKVKYSDFNQITRSKTGPAPLAAITDPEDIVSLLLAPIFPPLKGVRLLGVTLSSLERRVSAAEPQLR